MIFSFFLTPLQLHLQLKRYKKKSFSTIEVQCEVFIISNNTLFYLFDKTLETIIYKLPTKNIITIPI